MVKYYYELIRENNFFKQKSVRILRSIAGGNIYTIILLKLHLLASKNNMKLYIDSNENDFIDELSIHLNENQEDIRIALMCMENFGLIKKIEEEIPRSETISC